MLGNEIEPDRLYTKRYAVQIQLAVCLALQGAFTCNFLSLWVQCTYHPIGGDDECKQRARHALPG